VGKPDTRPDWEQGRWPEKSALHFDRDRMQMVRIADDPKLDVTGAITIAVWIHVDAKPVHDVLLSRRAGVAPVAYMLGVLGDMEFDYNDNSIQFGTFSDG